MSNINRNKSAVIKEISDLASLYQISLDEIKAAINPTKAIRTPAETWMKLLAYLGGLFIFSGICIYVGTFWTSMTTFTKITLTLGTGLVLYLLAVFLPSYYKSNENMSTPLFLISAFFQSTGLFIAFHELNSEMDPRVGAILIFAVLLIQQLLTFQKMKRVALIFTSVFFWSAFFVTFLDLLHASEKTISILVGLSLITIAYQLDKKNYKANANFWYCVGSITFLNGLFDALRNSWFELGFFAASGLLMYLSTLIKNRILLFVGTLSALGYIGYFTSKHFMHSTAWPILLVLLGLVCFGVGVMVIRISKKYMS